jgi:GntR family transcriptional regulator
VTDNRFSGYSLERGPVPLYHQVYLHLVDALGHRVWARGEQIPTERDLAESFGCSLITVRRALDELVREGRLERTRGRGTFVTTPPIARNILGPVGFADELRSLGYQPYSVVVTARIEEATPVVAKALAIAPRTPVCYLERVRGADGQPLVLEQVRLPAAMVPGLVDRDLGGEASLWDTLRDDYRRPVERYREMLSAVMPSAREAELLALRSRRPAVQFEGIAFTTDDVPIEHSRTVVSPERARYYVEPTGKGVRLVEPIGPTESADAAEAIERGEVAVSPAEPLEAIAPPPIASADRGSRHEGVGVASEVARG